MLLTALYFSPNSHHFTSHVLICQGLGMLHKHVDSPLKEHSVPGPTELPQCQLCALRHRIVR